MGTQLESSSRRQVSCAAVPQRLGYPNGFSVSNPAAFLKGSASGGHVWEPDIYVLCRGRGGRTSSVVLKDGRALTMLAGLEKGTRATIWAPR